MKMPGGGQQAQAAKAGAGQGGTSSPTSLGRSRSHDGRQCSRQLPGALPTHRRPAGWIALLNILCGWDPGLLQAASPAITSASNAPADHCTQRVHPGSMQMQHTGIHKASHLVLIEDVAAKLLIPA